MTLRQQKILDFLSSITWRDDDGFKIQPASDSQIEVFRARAIEKGLENKLIEELIEFYKIANAYHHDSTFGFHSCDDMILFEWWRDGELWLSQMHMDTIRWKDGKFCLGDAGSPSYSKDYVFDSLLDLIEDSVKWIKSYS